MSRTSLETVGVRYTGWAALNRDPLDDHVDFTCPHCGAKGAKAARRPRAEYHFTDGFLQDLQGEMRLAANAGGRCVFHPWCCIHDQEETRRFKAVFTPDLEVSKN